MDMSDFENFAEEMDHEFKSIDVKINKIGYKVDGEGIKYHCKFNEIKSVDYFHNIEDKLHLVEFSDLAMQHTCILQRIKKIKDCDLDKKEKILHIKELHKAIISEMRQKYIDSLTILRYMPKNISNIPAWAVVEKGNYIVIVAPTNDNVEASVKSDIVRILDKLKNDLTTSIPDELFVGVKVVKIDSFLQ
ncbi:hypothetical protein [Yersinia sp. Marseille-Q5920]|nr:hypothetical protein [Yersinia sp. Marseille-Q5920]